MPNPTKVKIKLAGKTPTLIVICTTYRRVESKKGNDKKIKYRKFATVTKQNVAQTFDLKHPGKGGLLSVLAINANDEVVHSAMRRLK